MPVILDNGCDDMFTWLDSNRSVWSKELQSLLHPFKGELECYPVSKDVGKVGNDSVALSTKLKIYWLMFITAHLHHPCRQHGEQTEHRQLLRKPEAEASGADYKANEAQRS